MTAITAARKTYTIADMAREYGVTARTLRYYEDQGLLSPAREGQNRIYSAGDHTKLGWVLRGKRVGFSLAEIAEMLELYDMGDGRTKQRLVTLEKCRERIKALEAQRDDINATLSELEGFCDLLNNLSYCQKNNCWINSRTGETYRPTEDDKTALFQQLAVDPQE